MTAQPKRYNEGELITVLSIICIILFVGLIGMFIKQQIYSEREIVIPKIAGVYTPITESGFAVIVLDTNDPNQAQLYLEVNRIFMQLAQSKSIQ